MSATVDPECSGLGEHVPATPQKVPRTCVRTEVPPTAPSHYCSWGKWPFLLLYSQVPGFIVVKNPPSSAGNAEDTGSAPGLGRSPGEGKATHSSPLAWEIPRTEGPGGRQSVGQQSQTGLSDRHAGLAAGLPRPRRGSQGDIPVGWFPASFPALKTHENRWTNGLPNTQNGIMFCRSVFNSHICKLPT